MELRKVIEVHIRSLLDLRYGLFHELLQISQHWLKRLDSVTWNWSFYYPFRALIIDSKQLNYVFMFIFDRWLWGDARCKLFEVFFELLVLLTKWTILLNCGNRYFLKVLAASRPFLALSLLLSVRLLKFGTLLAEYLRNSGNKWVNILRVVSFQRIFDFRNAGNLAEGNATVWFLFWVRHDSPLEI
jgi:hypothetical protein